MDADNEKLNFEMTRTEARRVNDGLKYLIESHLKSPEKVTDTPQEKLKDLSSLIVFQTNLNKDLK